MTAKDRIIQRASELFVQQGVRNVTMNDLAEHLGMSKRTIYENVKDKDELLVECLDYYESLAESKAKEFGKAKVIAILKELVDTGTSTVEQTMGNFFMEIKKYHPNVFENNVAKYRQRRLDRVRDFIAKGIEEEFFKADINVGMVAIIMSNMLMLIDKLDGMQVSRYQMPEVFRTIMITFCRGIATVSGIKQIDKAFQ